MYQILEHPAFDLELVETNVQLAHHEVERTVDEQSQTHGEEEEIGANDEISIE
jgi:hypothetical protein